MTNVINLAPTPLTSEDLSSLQFYCDGAKGLGIVLSQLPAENGWDSASFFDHPVGEVLLDAAIGEAKGFAKDNQLFYNTEKLEDYISKRLFEAYAAGFQSAPQPVLAPQPA